MVDPIPVVPVDPVNHMANLDARSPGSLVPEEFDQVVLTYAGGNLTVAQYYLATVLVATVNLTYVAGDLTDATAT